MGPTPLESPMDPGIFTAAVTSLAHSFGDETRRKIYLYVRENPGATAAELAAHCDVHPNVVRHHLERLAEAGYVTFDNLRRTTVGRPAKGYRVVDTGRVVDGALRRDALLVTMLEMALERLGPEAAESLAHDVGVAYGKVLGDSLSPGDSARSTRAAMASIAGVLTAHGFDAHLDDVDTAVVSDNCPFGTAALKHPVLCALDRGLVAGMLEGLGAASTSVRLTSKARGDDECRVTA